MIGSKMPQDGRVSQSFFQSVALGVSLSLAVPAMAFADSPMSTENAVEEDANTISEHEGEVSAFEVPDDLSEQSRDWLVALGSNVLRQLAQDASSTYVISPLGLGTVLSMLADGAGGDTANGYAAGLGIAASTALDTVASSWRDMSEPLTGVTLQGASGLWLASDFELHSTYVERSRELLDASVTHVDFHDPEVLDQINAWFAERTEDMIPKLLEDLSPETQIVLGNALYLDAQWQTAFDPDLTKTSDFVTAMNETLEVQMMQQEGHFLYRSDDLFQAVSLPFADPDFVMTVYLPHEEATAELVLNQDEGFGLDGFRPKHGIVELPRLDIHVGGDVSEILRSMGMLDGTDYSAMTDSPLLIDRVVQQVALKLHEDGATAAAATAATGVRSAAPEHFHLRADRPFALAITHVPTSTPLFMGIINSP